MYKSSPYVCIRCFTLYCALFHLQYVWFIAGGLTISGMLLTEKVQNVKMKYIGTGMLIRTNEFSFAKVLKNICLYFQLQQRDIESHSRVISAVLKLSDHLHDNNLDHEALETAAHSLERRWHGIWLQSLEWQCRLEDALSRKKVQEILSSCNRS